jgi:putative ABC transport system substrate-binding protein
VVLAYESPYQVAKESKIPIYSPDTSSVARGAVRTWVDYCYGRETGNRQPNLNGEKAGDIPVYTPQVSDLHVSPKMLKIKASLATSCYR